MTVDQIKKAVDEGKTVHWMNAGYRVIKDGNGKHIIKCDLNNHIIGLTWRDGVTLNGDEEDFYEAEDQINQEN